MIRYLFAGKIGNFFSHSSFHRPIGILILGSWAFFSGCRQRGSADSTLVVQNRASQQQAELDRKIIQLVSEGKFGFHLTSQKNVESIMKNGLLPAYGGVDKNGLCQKFAENSSKEQLPQVNRYIENSQGFVFFTKDLGEICDMSYMWTRRRQPYSVIGIDLKKLEQDKKSQHLEFLCERDKDFGRRSSAYKTSETIPPHYLIPLGENAQELLVKYQPKKGSKIGSLLCCVPSVKE